MSNARNSTLSQPPFGACAPNVWQRAVIAAAHGSGLKRGAFRPFESMHEVASHGGRNGNNNGNGIFIENGTENQLKENTANGNAVAGIAIAAGSTDNGVRGNTAQSNSFVDLADDNPNCDNNVWTNNVFNTASKTCIQ